MEETEVRGMKMSGEISEESESGELSSKERTNLDCYEQCINDMDDVNDDAYCASECGF